MNGKKSKRLRRQAERLTTGLPKIEYNSSNWRSRQCVLSPSCTRKVYLDLKKGA